MNILCVQQRKTILSQEAMLQSGYISVKFSLICTRYFVNLFIFSLMKNVVVVVYSSVTVCSSKEKKL